MLTEESGGLNWNHPCLGVVRVKDAEKGIVEEFQPDGFTKRKKVAIVGFASSSTMDAPFDDPEYSVWGLNQLGRFIPRADRWFEIHQNYAEYVVAGTDHVGFLRTLPIPVYMTRHWPEFPNSVRYPLERMVERFSDYFTSTIAYMLALAIDEGNERIDLFGIDLSVGTEYVDQRPCVERLIGYADALGITVGIPLVSSLCKHTHRYGYEQDPKGHGFLTEEDFVTRKQKLLSLRDTKVTQLNQLDGALAEVEHLYQGYQLRSRKATWNP